MYLDYNATAPLHPSLYESITETLTAFGNPSSIHQKGREARQIMEAARETLATFIGVQPRHIIFTASGTEANNAAIKGVTVDHYLISSIEHDCVREPALQTGKPVTFLEIGTDGVIDQNALQHHLDMLEGNLFVSVMAANNETGVIQPIAEIGHRIHTRGNAFFHVDAVQAFGKVPLDSWSWCADLMTLSFHKVGGPKGLSALIVKDGITLHPLLAGGGQEMRRRAGTENIMPMAAIPALIEWLKTEQQNEQTRLEYLRDHLETHLKERIEGIVLVAKDSPRLANTSCIVLPHKTGEKLVMRLDLDGIYVSAGSACSSGKIKHSHVLIAMGFTEEEALRNLRISLGWGTTLDDVNQFVDKLAQIVMI